MKITGIAFVIAGLVVLGIQLKSHVSANYHYENQYGQFWDLADKSSTIQSKQQLVSDFVAALEQGHERKEFSSYNAIWLKTASNSFEANLTALKTLSGRLTEIQKMDPSSFEYNTAIQQITGQEQGEAEPMLGVLAGCYRLKNYPLVWDWISSVVAIVGAVCLLGGVFAATADGW